MKKITLSILLILFFNLSAFSLNWPIKDTTRIKKFATKIKKLIKGFGIMKDAYSLYSDLDKTLKNAIELYNGGVDLVIDTLEWEEILDVLKDKNYYLNNNSWKNVIKEIISLDTKYPSLKEEFSQEYKNNKYYQENTEFRKFVDKNKKIFKEERLQQYINTKKLLSHLYKSDTDRMERLDNVYKRLKKAHHGGQSVQEKGKSTSLSCRVEIEEIMQLQETLLMIHNLVLKDLQNIVWELDQNIRYIKLNSNSKKNIENYLYKFQ